MTVYMAVTKDKYELPLFVTDSIQMMANWSGASVNTIRSATCQQAKGKGYNRSRWRRVEIEEE